MNHEALWQRMQVILHYVMLFSDSLSQCRAKNLLADLIVIQQSAVCPHDKRLIWEVKTQCWLDWMVAVGNRHPRLCAEYYALNQALLKLF